MSLHKSLVSKTVLQRDRNVLSRAERLKHVTEEGRWEEGQSVFGLPKVRIRRVKAGGKHKKAEKAEATAEATEAPAQEKAKK